MILAKNIFFFARILQYPLANDLVSEGYRVLKNLAPVIAMLVLPWQLFDDVAVHSGSVTIVISCSNYVIVMVL